MIRKPMQFQEAILYLLDKEQLPAEWDAAMWQDQESDFRTKAFWSAKVENARFLDRSQGLLFDYMTKVTDQVVGPDGVTRPAIRVAGREHFVKLMRDFMIAEGMARHEEFKSVNQKDVTDIRSLARLRLIFDTNIRQAYGFGQWKQGMTPAALRAFPAARLIRDRGVKEPRPRHQYNLGEVLLKTDPRWAEFHNDPLIGGFGVPWGPYGFNSGVTQEDVSREEARELGLAVESVSPQPAKITDGTQASTKGMDPALKAKLLAELRAEPSTPRKTPKDYAREAAAQVRRQMLNRGLTDAVGRGDSGKAAKYRKAIAELPEPGLNVREVGDKIVLESAGGAGIVPALPNDPERDRNPETETRKLPGTNQDRTLAEASNDARSVLRADGTINGDEDELDLVRIQLESLALDAERNGYLYEEPDRYRIGGVEHDVIPDQDSGTILKFTKSGRAAYTVNFDLGTPRMAPALPLEYLDRLMLQNEIFSDNIRFVGIVGTTDHRRIVTRQDLVEGRPARWEEIVRLMTDLGFTKLRHNHGIGYEDSYAFVRDDAVVFDMRPANVFVTDDGIIVPVDSIPVKLPPGKRKFFDK